MDSAKIISTGKDLNKAVKSNADAAVLIKLLKELKQGVVATEASLRATAIGSTVNSIRKHPNSEVAQLASSIVTKWREAVSRDKQKKEGGSTSTGKGTPTGTSSPAPPVSQEKNGNLAGPPKGVDPSQRTHKTDKIDVKPTGNSTRDNCAGLLYNGVVYMSQLPPKQILDVAIAVEAAIFKNFGPEEKPAYKAKVRSLFQNLKSKSNASLRTNVANGKISPGRFVTMSDEDLKSPELKEEEKKLEDENMRVAQVSQEVPSVTDTLSCPKCHKREVSFYQAQTRSADEPMTTFCTCQPCGHQWRFS